MTLAVPDGALTLDPSLGNLRGLRFWDGRQWIDPLHSAPWLDEVAIHSCEDIPLVERHLSGDFLCAPFGISDSAPIHGWTANSAWRIEEVMQSGQQAEARLSLGRPVMGAEVTKQLRLRRGEPLLYQAHRLSGGEGALTLAHHPMVHMASGGQLSFSPKRLALTGPKPPEPGRNWLQYPAETTDLTAFPGRDGPVNLHHYPPETGHEDFLTLVEAEGNTLGWTAVVRAKEDDLIFVLRDAEVLPVTMLWYSNGGRDYAPWNGRHTGVLGIEDGRTPGDAGHAMAAGENPVSRAGVPSHLPLAPDRVHTVRHVIGAVPRPEGWRSVTDISIDQNTLRLTGDDGGVLCLPFDGRFFRKD